MIEAILTMRPAPSAIMPRTTYLVSTIGDSVFTRTCSSILALCIIASAPSIPIGGVVDEAEQRAEFLAQTVHQPGNFVDFAEVEWHEMQRAFICALGLRKRRREILIFAPGNSDDPVARPGEFLTDGETEAAAAAGHEYAARRIRHVLIARGAPACRPRQCRALARN